MYSIGIDIGYSSVKTIILSKDKEILFSKYSLHHGRTYDVLKSQISSIESTLLNNITMGAYTGNKEELLVDKIAYVNEVTSLVEGCMFENIDIKSIIEIGGQSSKYITNISKKDKSRIKVTINSSCSAGTGSFIEELVSRLGITLENYSKISSQAESIPRIAGRCSVFAKTDITHHQQNGTPIPDILKGLSHAVVKNYRGSVMRKLDMMTPILFVGGVAHNQEIYESLLSILKLEKDTLFIPRNFNSLGALGAAIIAQENQLQINMSDMQSHTFLNSTLDSHTNSNLYPLSVLDTIEVHNKHLLEESRQEKINCYLGIDVGSTSTNLVLLDTDDKIITFKYLRTLGNPINAIQKGLTEIKNEFCTKLNILGTGVTGSGRYMIGKYIGADMVKDEITAQAKAAYWINKDVDTIFEIGGQDSKFISINNGKVVDFHMNKVCAAGTGSFIEEQSKKFNIPINDFGQLALKSTNPANLEERCTVFIESSISLKLAINTPLEDIAAGLCYSIVKNYLNRVVSHKKIGDNIHLQGGIAFNQGIINAFRILTKKEILIPPYFSTMGALGIAIILKEELSDTKKTLFKGIDIDLEKELKIEKRKLEASNNQDVPKFCDRLEKIIFEKHVPQKDSSKKTIGIPRTLFTYGLFPMFSTFLREMGFNIELSESTNDETIKLGQEFSLEETCYPVKLITGHVAELVNKNVDYIFFPDLYTADHQESKTRQNFGCAYMQLAFRMVDQAMKLEERGIQLLSPTLAFNMGKDFMMESFIKLGKQLGVDTKTTQAALKKGMEQTFKFRKELSAQGKDVIEKLPKNEKILVIISKLYGVLDPILNMGIPDKLEKMGYKVILFSDLFENDIFDEHPNMYWPFEQHVLGSAKIVKEHPNMFAVFLTHHGCGPDSITLHYFQEIMDDKPYLNIEIDEHSSDVGVITRIEAFLNSINSIETVRHAFKPLSSKNTATINMQASLKLNNDSQLILPNLYPYSQIFESILSTKGVNTKVLSFTNEESINEGRKYILTNEYYSLVGLLGDVFKFLKDKNREENISIFLPQNEGGETDGQYSRLLRTKLDQKSYKNINIISPFIEDALLLAEEDRKLLFHALIAGDLIRTVSFNERTSLLKQIINFIEDNNFNLTELTKIAQAISQQKIGSKKILLIGEPFILFNDYMNNNLGKILNEKRFHTVYAPMSEYMWFQWRDYAVQNNAELLTQIKSFQKSIKIVSNQLKDNTPFILNLDEAVKIADDIVGYYSGLNARYRGSKIFSTPSNVVSGIITLSSLYENTGIALNILQKYHARKTSIPILDLTFDGGINKNNNVKIESFLFYLK